MTALVKDTELSHPRLPEILDSLCIRFIMNCPQEELQSFERFFFQIEQAHWYYDDNYREQDPSLPSFTLKQFAEICTKT
jgi:mRNA-decapping enzyme subunit 2